jgi:hypothetical protein
MFANASGKRPAEGVAGYRTQPDAAQQASSVPHLLTMLQNDGNAERQNRRLSGPTDRRIEARYVRAQKTNGWRKAREPPRQSLDGQYQEVSGP